MSSSKIEQTSTRGKDSAMRKMNPALVTLSVAAMMMTGCSSRGPQALPTISSLPQQDSQAVGSARYATPGEGQIEIYHQGYGARSVGGVAVPTLRIQVSVRNSGAAPMVFAGGASHLVDNRGDTLHLGAMKRDGQPTTTKVEVEAGQHAQIDLFYDLPANYAMEKVENFRIYWGYQDSSDSVSTETLFVRKDPENMYWVDRRGKKRGYRYFMAVKV
jgi:hypothetical protein